MVRLEPFIITPSQEFLLSIFLSFLSLSFFFFHSPPFSFFFTNKTNPFSFFFPLLSLNIHSNKIIVVGPR